MLGVTARKIWGEFLPPDKGRPPEAMWTHSRLPHHDSSQWSSSMVWSGSLHGQNKGGTSLNFSPRQPLSAAAGSPESGSSNIIWCTQCPAAVGRGSRAHISSPIGSKAQRLTSNSLTPSELPPWTAGWMSPGSVGAEAESTESW